MKVICFGDSNTYGYDPRSWLGERYPAHSRWVDLLAAGTGWEVLNMGQNGREIPRHTPVFPPDTGLLILMLGTNDLLRGRSPQQAAGDLDRFLSELSLEPGKILLAAPPPLTLGEWVPDKQLIENSAVFARHCAALARQHGISFVNAGDWGISLTYDGVHFTEQGHRTFAAKLMEVLK